MLPDFLAGSYKRYKEDTLVFTTWLAKAAQACGYYPDVSKQDAPKQKQAPAPVLQPRLKGRARVLAKKATKEDGTTPTPSSPAGSGESRSARMARYAITTEDIIKQAEAVASASKKGKGLQLPANLAQVVERAISARARCTNWFRTVTKATGGSADDDEKHAYFTNTLSAALRILKPVTEDRAASTGRAQPQTRSMNGPKESAIDTLHNRFDLLHVEEPTEVVDMDAANVESVRKPTKNKVSQEDQLFELLLDFQEELVFESYCLFEDMHQIQEYVMGVWAEYRADSIDLMTATLTTNAAIDMVKHMEANITSRAPNLFPKKEAYWRFLTMLQIDQAHQQGYDLDDRLAGTKMLEITAFDDFLYLPTARTAAAMYGQYQAKVMYPQLIMPARTGYIARPELLELPKYKQMQDEHERLAQMLMDMTFYLDMSSQYDKREKGPAWQSQRHSSDNITKAAAAMKYDGEFSVWIIFACRTLLDIQTTMGSELGKAWKETISAFDKQWNIMAYKQMPGGALGFDHGLYWATENGEVPMRMWYLIGNTTQRPLMKVKPIILEENAKRGGGPKLFKPGELPPEYQAMADEQ